jgi:FtsP/CotA-like multicopper oxidase with cupredoxin domain
MFFIVIVSGLAIPMFSVFFWIIAIITSLSLSHSKSNRTLYIKRNIILSVMVLPILAIFLWLLVVMMTGFQQGWIYIDGFVTTIIPLYLLGYFPVILFSLPRLLAIRDKNKTNVLSSTHVKLLDPMLLIPIIGAGLASIYHLACNLFAQSVSPDWIEITVRLILYLIVLFIPSLFILRTYQSAVNGNIPLSSGWKKGWQSICMLGLMIGVLIPIAVVSFAIGMSTSKLPESSDMMNHENIDEGGVVSTTPFHMSHHSPHSDTKSTKPSVAVKNLTGDISAPADQKFTMIAQQKDIILPSGKKITTWTYNGQIAPQIHVKEGEMIEIKLINRDLNKGVTIHWHGYNVPNAMDGVPGMTQNVVKPGQSFTYKFRANQVGTYWFHSHQQASEQVQKGLFGTLIVDPKKEVHHYDQDVTLIHHRWSTGTKAIVTLGNHDQEQQKQVKAGQKIRIRIINSDNTTRPFVLHGVRFKVTSIDGMPLPQPTMLPTGTTIQVASGGRYDVTFTMPRSPVYFGMTKYEGEANQGIPGLLFKTKENQSKPVIKKAKTTFDPTNYGTGVQNELTQIKKFDRTFQMVMGNKMGFYNGKFGYLWTINDKVYPNTPTFVVKKGDRVKVTFINKSLGEHPMHLHGHHMTVLKKNGKPVQTPWQTDTLALQLGESYEIAFVADNPGMWMDHCHNLDHAAMGMTMHLMYENVTSSYEVGSKSGNIPD